MSLILSFLLVSLRFSYPVIAQSQNVQFGQVSNLNGDMQLNSFVFPDNSKIEAFSQTQRQILVNQNSAPVPASHVMGSTGQPFVQLSTNSMTISTNGATDLVGAQIEMSINPAMLQQSNVTAENTFVAMLSPNRQAWIVMEGLKSVNTTDNTVRMIKLNSIDGEYIAVGRQTTETSNVLTPFGTSQQQSVNITGSGIQEVEFQDGFRMSIMASKPMTVNANVVNGVSTSMLNGAMSVNNYRYLVTTNLAGVVPNLNQMMAVVQLPLNANRLMAMAMSMGIGANDTLSLGISQRGVMQNPGGATGGSLPPQKRQKKASSSSKVTSTKEANSKTSSSAASEATAESADPDTSSSTNSTATASVSADAAASLSSSAIANSSTASSDAASTTPPPASGQQPANTNPQNPAATQLLLSPTFTPISARTVLDMTNSRVAVTTNQLDGEFIVTMAKAGAQNAAQVPLGQVSSTGQTTQNKRQSTQTQGQSGLLVTMTQLKTLVQMQKNGGMLPVLDMMNEMKDQSQTIPPFRQKRTRALRMPLAV